MNSRFDQKVADFRLLGRPYIPLMDDTDKLLRYADAVNFITHYIRVDYHVSLPMRQKSAKVLNPDSEQKIENHVRSFGRLNQSPTQSKLHGDAPASKPTINHKGHKRTIT